MTAPRRPTFAGDARVQPDRRLVDRTRKVSCDAHYVTIVGVDLGLAPADVRRHGAISASQRRPEEDRHQFGQARGSQDSYDRVRMEWADPRQRQSGVTLSDERFLVSCASRAGRLNASLLVLGKCLTAYCMQTLHCSIKHWKNWLNLGVPDDILKRSIFATSISQQNVSFCFAAFWPCYQSDRQREGGTRCPWTLNGSKNHRTRRR